jgi:hypothetical protein|tara:strand:- start:4316 stop:4576 length:261 start_codon:yes stop_codon:yes gene_type:complete
MELFEDIDRDFNTMKNKIKGTTTRSSRVQQTTCWAVEMYEDNVLIETRELPGKSIHYANDTAENWNKGIIQKTTKHYLDDWPGGIG